MGALLTADGLLALATLSAMEIVLGIDNVVFIAILVGRLPEARRELARRLGLILALGIRILLLFAISWMMGLTAPLVTVLGHGVSGRDLILLGGGLFLIFKATWEIYDKVEAGHHERTAGAARAAFAWVIFQILLLDIVFSLDSVITAVGMANDLAIMVTAMASCTVLLPNLGRHRRARLIIRVILDGEEERDGQGGRGAADEFRRSVAQDREPPSRMAALRQAQVPVRQRDPAWPLLVPALARGRPAMPTIRST